MHTHYNKPDLNRIKNINVIKKIVSQKNDVQLENDHFILFHTQFTRSNNFHNST